MPVALPYGMCKRILLFLLVSIFCQPSFADWKREIAFEAGFLFAPAEIGLGRNLAGGEKLTAKLRRSVVSGLRTGLHKNYVGFQANAVWYSRQAAVENEFGVEFPDHATTQLSFTGALVIHTNSTIEPYASFGGGAFLLFIDLDNIEGLKMYVVPSLEVAFGIKFPVGGKRRFLYSEYRIAKAAGRDEIRSFQLQTLFIGFGFVR